MVGTVSPDIRQARHHDEGLDLIESETALQSSRPRVLELISLIPGIHLRELCRLLGLSFTSTRYQVDKLCKTGEISRERRRGHVRLFPAGLELEDKMVYTFLRTKRFRDVLTALATNLQLTNKEICALTKLPKSTVSGCVHELVEVGLVKDHPSTSGGTTTYQICDPEYLLQVLMHARKSSHSPGSNIGSSYTRIEKFDLWDLKSKK